MALFVGRQGSAHARSTAADDKDLFRRVRRDGSHFKFIARPGVAETFHMLELEKARGLVDSGVVEVAPLAFMRGRTLNDAFVILDEAQNTTTEQMKMFLTRIGFGSRAVITGDVTQIDLPRGTRSGLLHAVDVLHGVPDIGFTYFSDRDVVRHPIVQAIVQAYQRADQRSSETIRPPDATGTSD